MLFSHNQKYILYPYRVSLYFFLYVHVMVIFFDDEKICNVRCLWLLLTFSLLKRFKLMLNINIWCWLNNTQHIYLILKYFVGCIKWIKTIYYNTYHSLSPLPCSNYLFTFKSTSTCCNMISKPRPRQYNFLFFVEHPMKKIWAGGGSN